MRLIATILLAAFSVALFAQERNCATMEVLEQQLLQDPDLGARMEAIERHTEDFHHTHGDGSRVVITIPVVFHIVHNGDALGTNENTSDALVQAQLDQLNQDFALLNSDASLIPQIFQGVATNTEIQFCLAQRKPDGTATNGINRINGGQASWTTSQINSNLKPSTIWDRNQYLNIWSVVFGGSSSGLLGYAQFPGGAASTDGVVVLYSSVGSVAMPHPQGGNYARGRTATHEVGHWLNLRHIWGDATCGNDLVADTPVHNTSNGGCPSYPHFSTCTGTPIEMTMNYMDYTFDACMYMFTLGQKNRMQAVLAAGGARVSLVTSQGCVPPGGSTCGTPSGLSASAVTGSSATLSWAAVSGASTYNVRYRQVGTAIWTTVSVGGTSTSIGGLSASTQYEFQVQAVCGESLGSFSASATFSTTAQSCGTPTGLFASGITANSATLNWTAVSGALSYNVRYRQSGTTTWTNLSTSATSATVSGLLNTTQYEFQVQAVCSSGTGSYSASSTFVTIVTQGCGTPVGLNATFVTSNSAVLNWVAVSGATSYNVRWRQIATTAWTTGTTASTSLSINGLVARTTYEFQVQAVCNGTPGSFSDSAIFATGSSDGSECGTPSGLAATAVTNTTATLNWLSVSGAISYNVRYRAVSEINWITNTTGAISLAISGLTASTQYEFQVQAICSSGSSAFSTSASFITTGTNCGTPTGLNATNIGTISATLNWSSVSGAVSYNVRYRATGAANWINNTTTATSFVVNTLTAGTEYEFQVQAVCSIAGSFSASAIFSTTSPATCGTPTGLNATNISTNSATLNWSAVSGAVSYNVRYRATGAANWINTTSTGTSVAVTGLTQNTQYEFQVQALCSIMGSFSASATFTTSFSGCPDNYEPNDERSAALPLTSIGVDLLAQIANATDLDWYRFANTAAQPNIRVDLSNLPADYDLYLYQDKFVRAFSQNSGTTPEFVTYNNGSISSTYYAYVYGYNGAFNNTTCYTLRISLSNTAFRTDGSSAGEVTEFEIPVQVLSSGFAMFPNPANTEVTLDVHMDAERAVKVSLMDVAGKRVLFNTYDLQKEQNRITLDVSALPAGLYVVQVENGKTIGSQKLTISKP